MARSILTDLDLGGRQIIGATAPTPSPGDSSQALATTAFVGGEVSGSSGTSVVVKTSAYTVTSNDNFIIADTSAGTFIVTLPALSGSNKRFNISCAGLNDLTVKGNGAELIEDANTIDIEEGEAITIVPMGTTKWVIV